MPLAHSLTESIYKSEGWASTLLMIGPGTLIGRSYWLVEGDRGWTERETWPLSTSDDNRRLTVGVAGCARPGPQVPDAMPTSIARQVSEWQVRESEVRECVLVYIYKRRMGMLATHDWSMGVQTLLMIGQWGFKRYS
jgi:hypothetical protein